MVVLWAFRLCRYSFRSKPNFQRIPVNAEAIACRQELSDASIDRAKQLTTHLSAKTEIDKELLSSVFYVLGFDDGRRMEQKSIKSMAQLLSRNGETISQLQPKDLAIISAALHRAQLSITDQRVLKTLLNALQHSNNASISLRIMKELDLSIRKFIPPESLPPDDELVEMLISLGRVMSTDSVQPSYASRVIRFWQKLRIISPEIEEAMGNFCNRFLEQGTDKPLRDWRIKDISQVVFTMGYFNMPWSPFCDAVVKEIENRFLLDTSYGSTDVIKREMNDFPDSYVQVVMGLVTHKNSPLKALSELVSHYLIFSRPPSEGRRSLEAWMALRTACNLEVDVKMCQPINDDSERSSNSRLTGRQYMVIQSIHYFTLFNPCIFSLCSWQMLQSWRFQMPKFQ